MPMIANTMGGSSGNDDDTSITSGMSIDSILEFIWDKMGLSSGETKGSGSIILSVTSILATGIGLYNTGHFGLGAGAITIGIIGLLLAITCQIIGAANDDEAFYDAAYIINIAMLIAGFSMGLGALILGITVEKIFGIIGMGLAIGGALALHFKF